MKILLVLLLNIVYCLFFLSTAVAANQDQLNNNRATSTIAVSELSTSKVSTGKIKLCAVYPHLKDSYWLSINFGMTEQAKQRSIELKVLDAGGYQNKDEQLRQIEQCIHWQASAILVGSVNFEALNQKLAQVNKHTPVFALVNEIATNNISGRTGVSWYQMGYQLGEYLVKHHQNNFNTTPATLAWFPGPKRGGGSLQSTKGLQAALVNSPIEIIAIEHGLNEKITQFSLLKDTLKKYNNIDYLAGNAVMAEMAINEVGRLPKEQQPEILSHYLSHGVYRGIKRHKILMANSDQMVLQGKMAINQAVDYLKIGKVKTLQAPTIITIDQATIKKLKTELSLSPSNFKPIYSIKATEVK
ncbi:TMAO reductase system periplasmic protein TorT [Colwellia psychrerythraea]|uniref:Periplasmic protein TorT n=1 Tax=Colwellia psychrerythraea (strain 34H / ATCC BAA-681) TaxID=167879 RepID=Q484F8_COLP3|nr:TMAO reductase system periplasmic protein TorT [Colwellia psychrerythraea]AAZ27599.1 periplasmic protein TorT [Colwellia psychrerythraea 34H]